MHQYKLLRLVFDDRGELVRVHARDRLSDRRPDRIRLQRRKSGLFVYPPFGRTQRVFEEELPMQRFIERMGQYRFGNSRDGDGSMVNWFLQEAGSEIGHSIAMMPAAKALSSVCGPVPFYFESESVRDLYRDCPFIRILETPPAFPPLFRSSEYGTGAGTVDRWYLRGIRRFGYQGDHPGFYVDRVPPDRCSVRPTIGVVHGSRWDGEYMGAKTLPLETRQDLVELPRCAGARVVVLGSIQDHNRFWSVVPTPPGTFNLCGRPIRIVLKAIQACDLILANDSGLAHVSGASKVPTVVFCRGRMPSWWKMNYGPQHRYDDSDFAESIRDVINSAIQAVV